MYLYLSITLSCHKLFIGFSGEVKKLMASFQNGTVLRAGHGRFRRPWTAKKSPAEKVSAEVIPCLFSEVKKLWAGCQFIASGTGFR
jgi:hypothetical protein